MLSTRILLIVISTALSLSLFIYNNVNSETPKSDPVASVNKNQFRQVGSIHNSAQDDDTHSLRSEFQDLKAEMALLNSSHTELARIVDNLQSSEESISEPDTNDEFRPDFTESGHALVEQRIASMEKALAEETVDSAWSNSTIDQVQMAFDSNELEGANIVDLDCRNTLCRIEIDVDNPIRASEYQLWLSAKVGDILPQASMTVSQDDEGHASAILFMAREGYNLPAMEE